MIVCFVVFCETGFHTALASCELEDAGLVV